MTPVSLCLNIQSFLIKTHMHIHTVTYLCTYLASSQLNLSPAGLIIQLLPVST